MKIINYKFSCVSWKLDENSDTITSTQKIDEKYFDAIDPLAARREGSIYMEDHLVNFIDFEKALKNKQVYPPFAYHLRLYFVLEDGQRFCIYSKSNYEIGEPYLQGSLLKNLDYETSIYEINNYNLGGEIHLITDPDDERKYKVLFDTAVQAIKSIES